MLYPETEIREMDELLEDFIRALVSEPDEVEIESTCSENTVILTIDVLNIDRGKIIGRQGSIIESLKVLFKALGSKNGKRVHLEIKE